MRTPTPISCSVVIPALNEAGCIGATIAAIRSQSPHVEIIVADGGSVDSTRDLAAKAGATVITAPRGRGNQCAAGARAASGAVLVFLHADTYLPEHGLASVGQATRDDRFQIGSFRLAFDHSHWALALFAWMSRFDTMFTRFGDQGIVIRRDFLDALGGFPEQPLFEDTELLKRARRHGPIRLLPATVVTSARRFRRLGILRAQLLNARLMIRFMAGATPEVLAAEREFYLAGDGEASIVSTEVGR